MKGVQQTTNAATTTNVVLATRSSVLSMHACSCSPRPLLLMINEHDDYFDLMKFSQRDLQSC